MLQNYIAVAWRTLRKHRFYSIINISGLTAGILCFLFIFLYVKDELNYDRFHSDASRMYRLNFYGKLGDQVAHTAACPAPMGPTFKQAFPEIEEMCRFRRVGRIAFRYENQSYSEERAIFADSTLFELFSFKLLQGNPETVLKEPKTLILTETMAQKYFGRENPIGKALLLDNRDYYKVTGVMAEIPQNSHIRFDFFMSLSSLESSREDEWGSTNFPTYFMLKPGADPAALSKKMTGIFVERFERILKQYLNTNWEEFAKTGNYARVELFPMSRIHLHSDLDDELGPNGDVKYVYIFSFIGLFILALACVNFMNLATARAATRAKEVGVRKAVGAARSDLALQFVGEGLALSLAALLFALTFLPLLLPSFNNLSGKTLGLSAVYNPVFLLSAFVLTLLTGLAAGSYPAFFLSAFQPHQVLKSVFSGVGSKSGLRNGLVVFQFFTTTVLLIGALVVYRQLDFIRNKKLGYDKDRVLVLREAYLLDKNVEVFRARLGQMPAVKHFSVSGFLPALSDRNASALFKGRVASNENTMLVGNWWVDRDFLKTMGIAIVEGRDFSRDISTDSAAVVVNETLARSFGYPHQPVVGQEIGLSRDEGRVDVRHIIGVAKNFHYASLRENIEPLAIFNGNSGEFISIRFNTEDIAGLIEQVRAAWVELAPGQPFNYTFLDERFEHLYETENRIGKIMVVFAFLAIFVACIGLLGLATFTAAQRTKEIGIRKVLGASVAGITGLLAKDFLKLVLLAIVLAAPAAWYGMQKWLSSFAYRIDLQWWMFAVAGLAAVVLAFLTVSFQSVKAALANPVRSLRSE